MKALIWTWFTGSWKCFQKNHLRQRFKETVRPDMFVPATQLFPFALLLPHRSELSYLKYIKTRCQLHTDGIRTKMLWCYDQNSADLRLRSFTTYSCMFFPQLVLHHVRSFSDYYDQFIEVHAKRLFVLWMLSLLLHLAQKIYHEEHGCYDMLWPLPSTHNVENSQAMAMTSKLYASKWHWNRNDTTAESPSAVTLLLPCPSRSSRPSRLSPSPWDSSCPLCPSWSSQSHAATFWHFCVQQGFIHFLYMFLIVSYCLILFHIVSFCFQVKLQIGRNDQNQNISKQSLWQRRLQKRCPGSPPQEAVVPSQAFGKAGRCEKNSIIIVAYVSISIMYIIYIYLYLYLYLYLIYIYISILFEMYRWECTGVESSGHLPAALIKQVAQFKM